METLKSFLDQSLLIWKDSTAAARFGISLLLVICLGAIVGVGVWSSQPQYVLLAADLDPAKVPKLTEALEAADINYEHKGSTNIWVDKRKRDDARTAAIKLGIGSASFDPITPDPWASPAVIDEARLHNRQLALKRTLEDFPSINEATVHLGEPEKSAFLGRNRTDSTASVKLTLAPKSNFDDAIASSVASLVANAVPGLTPERVSIVDTDGRKYSTDESFGNLTKKEEFRLRRERELTQKVSAALYPTLGFENFTVTVTTDFAFPDETIETIELDSDNKVASKEIISSSSTSSEDKPAFGAAGVTANNGSSPPRVQGKKEIITKQEDQESEFRIPETSKIQKLNTPIMNWMSVSVAINSTKLAGEGEAIPPETIADYENHVRSAVGFREETDEVKVTFMPFLEQEVEEAPSPFITLPWDRINKVLENLSLGLAALVALIVAYKALRKIQPDPSLKQETNDRDSQVDQLSELVKQNPEVFSKIIESWSSLDSKEETPDKSLESKAA